MRLLRRIHLDQLSLIIIFRSYFLLLRLKFLRWLTDLWLHFWSFRRIFSLIGLISWDLNFNVHGLYTRRLRRHDRVFELFKVLIDVIDVEISWRRSILSCWFFPLIPIVDQSFESQQSLSVSLKWIAETFHQSSSETEYMTILTVFLFLYFPLEFWCKNAIYVSYFFLETCQFFNSQVNVNKYLFHFDWKAKIEVGSSDWNLWKGGFLQVKFRCYFNLKTKIFVDSLQDKVKVVTIFNDDRL